MPGIHIFLWNLFPSSCVYWVMEFFDKIKKVGFFQNSEHHYGIVRGMFNKEKRYFFALRVLWAQEFGIIELRDPLEGNADALHATSCDPSWNFLLHHYHLHGLSFLTLALNYLSFYPLFTISKLLQKSRPYITCMSSIEDKCHPKDSHVYMWPFLPLFLSSSFLPSLFASVIWLFHQSRIFEENDPKFLCGRSGRVSPESLQRQSFWKVTVRGGWCLI